MRAWPEATAVTSSTLAQPGGVSSIVVAGSRADSCSFSANASFAPDLLVAKPNCRAFSVDERGFAEHGFGWRSFGARSIGRLREQVAICRAGAKAHGVKAHGTLAGPRSLRRERTRPAGAQRNTGDISLAAGGVERNDRPDRAGAAARTLDRAGLPTDRGKVGAASRGAAAAKLAPGPIRLELMLQMGYPAATDAL